jgi:hypothetical protein
VPPQQVEVVLWQAVDRRRVFRGSEEVHLEEDAAPKCRLAELLKSFKNRAPRSLRVVRLDLFALLLLFEHDCDAAHLAFFERQSLTSLGHHISTAFHSTSSTEGIKDHTYPIYQRVRP